MRENKQKCRGDSERSDKYGKPKIREKYRPR